MGAMLWRWAKVLLLGWAALSLLGLAAVVTLAVYWEHQYDQRATTAVDLTPDSERVAGLMMAAGFPMDPARAIARIERRYCSPDGIEPTIEGYGVRLTPEAVPEVVRRSAVAAAAWSPAARSALAHAGAALRAGGQTWWPDAALPERESAAWADVHFDGRGLREYSVALLSGDGRTLFVAQSFHPERRGEPIGTLACKAVS
jgi:hypothetical protein